MSFDSIKFAYTPPPTVPATIPVNSVQQPGLFMNPGQTNSLNTSVAGQLIARAKELLNANRYLQDVILARSQGLGVEFDPAVDPSTAQSLEILYPNQIVPTSLTVNMYGRMLDAELAALQIDTALGTNSACEVNAFQAAAVSQVAQAIENGLLNSGKFQYQLPLLLRQLKGDTALFNTVATELARYPVLAAPAASLTSGKPSLISVRGQDVSPALSSIMNDAFDSFQSSYASVYQLAATTGVIDQDVNNVLNQYFIEPAANLIRMTALFDSLIGFAHLPRLKSVVNGLTGYAFMMLIAEASTMEFMADRFIQTAIMPLRQITSNIGDMVKQVQLATALVGQAAGGVKQAYNHTTGGLKGMSFGYSCGLPHNAAAQKPAVPESVWSVPGVGKMSQGLTALATHLDWAQHEGMKKASLVQESFQKLLQRRVGDMNTQLDLMCSTQALNTLTQLARSVLSFTGSAAPVGGTQTISQMQAVTQIMNGMQSATGSSYVVVNSQMQAVPPSVPAPPSSVQTTLVNGGLTLVATSAAVKAPTLGAS